MLEKGILTYLSDSESFLGIFMEHAFEEVEYIRMEVEVEWLVEIDLTVAISIIYFPIVFAFERTIAKYNHMEHYAYREYITSMVIR